MKIPTEQDAMAIAQAVLQQSVQSIQRFPTGLCHYVYDVTLANGQQVVIRIAHAYTQALLAGGVFWSERLRSHNVPLPQILHADLSATKFPFAFVVLERLPGTDLGHVYSNLTRQEKQGIATAIAQIQARVHQLPWGSGFGYARSLNEPELYSSWTELVEVSLNNSEQRLETSRLVDGQSVNRVRTALNQFQGYLDNVEPIAFLDDTTTKNVLIHQGKLSGIVDVDEVCYGDPLWTVALTQMALLKQQVDLDYITAWTDALKLTAEQQLVLDVYTAVFCLDFLSELEQQFNKSQTQTVDAEMVQHLTKILNTRECLKK